MQKIIMLIALVTTIGCSKKMNESIYIEKIPSDKLTDKNRFDRDNIVYPIDRKQKFGITILDKNDSVIKNDTKYLKLNILGGTEPFSKFDPNYSQTVLEFLYFNQDGLMTMKEKTGLIENKKNIWFHPPRSKEVGILQLSAFPYIKFDEKKWKWELEASFENYRKINLVHTYTKKEKINYESEFGNLECDVIRAKTTSSIGTTSSYFLYNNNYGFVLLKFVNIDDTTIVLNLIK